MQRALRELKEEIARRQDEGIVLKARIGTAADEIPNGNIRRRRRYLARRIDEQKVEHATLTRELEEATPAVTTRAEAKIGEGARIDGIPGARERIRLWSMIGICTKADLAANIISLVNVSGGAPGKPLPDRGEVVPLPQIVSEPGKASLKMIKPGMQVTAIYSVPTAFDVTIFSLW